MKKITELLPLLTATLIGVSYASLHGYYSVVNISIYNYIEATELIFSFIPNFYYVLFAIAMALVIYVINSHFSTSIPISKQKEKNITDTLKNMYTNMGNIKNKMDELDILNSEVEQELSEIDKMIVEEGNNDDIQNRFNAVSKKHHDIKNESSLLRSKLVELKKELAEGKAKVKKYRNKFFVLILTLAIAMLLEHLLLNNSEIFNDGPSNATIIKWLNIVFYFIILIYYFDYFIKEIKTNYTQYEVYFYIILTCYFTYISNNISKNIGYEAISNGETDYISFVSNDMSVESDSINIFYGETRNHIFLYNKSKKITSVYFKDDIDSLRIGNHNSPIVNNIMSIKTDSINEINRIDTNSVRSQVDTNANEQTTN